RTGFGVKQPRKKSKTGIQQYRICEAETGYCLDFEYYSASKEEPYDFVKIDGYDIDSFTLPAKIVLHLIKPYLNRGHTLGIDSYYSDPRLFELLLRNKTDAVGTFQSNRRFFPTGVKATKLPVGYVQSWYKKFNLNDNDVNENNDVYENDNENAFLKYLMCLIWQDKKTVRIVSTYHDDELLSIPDKAQFRVDLNATKLKPRACIEYKYVMPGVDKMDQMMSTYDPTRKRMKRYYKRVYFTLLEMCFYNSFVVYCHLMHPKKVTYLDYKKDVVKRTIDKYCKKFYKNTDGAIHINKLLVQLEKKAKCFGIFSPSSWTTFSSCHWTRCQRQGLVATVSFLQQANCKIS
ncbi:unnamed protein product, partial [Meganyctiphanes norvegica]